MCQNVEIFYGPFNEAPFVASRSSDFFPPPSSERPARRKNSARFVAVVVRRAGLVGFLGTDVKYSISWMVDASNEMFDEMFNHSVQNAEAVGKPDLNYKSLI